MIALVAFGGFASLSVDDGSGNDLTGDWKKPKWVKQVQKTVAAPIKKVSEEMKDLVEKKSPKPIMCAQVVTYACEKSNLANCKDFPNACIPEGWIKGSKPSLSVIRPSPTPIITPQLVKPSPTCPQECAGPGSFCHNNRLPACPDGTRHDGAMDVQSKNISCKNVCILVPKKACRIDINNCPPALKSYYKSNILSGIPDSRYDANGINGQCLIDSSNLKNSFGNQYWKYSAPCGKILQRQ